MARTTKRNPHETQTKLGLLLAVISALSALTLTYCVLRRFNFEEFAAQYVEGSPRHYVILGSTFVAAAASTIGFFVSLNAAGQRRNKLSGLAWKMFFVNAAVIGVTLCVFVLFYFAKEQVYLRPP